MQELEELQDLRLRTNQGEAAREAIQETATLHY